MVNCYAIFLLLLQMKGSFDRFARMTELPIKVLVEALEQQGQFHEKEGPSAHSNQRTKDNGFEGKYSCKCKSQYISALMLVAPKRKRNRNKFGWRNTGALH
jgi:5-enolpyruvylshikimate-3-phosphate synthase